MLLLFLGFSQCAQIIAHPNESANLQKSSNSFTTLSNKN
jgi:hypothetical protein